MYIEYYIIENLLINYIIISCTCILTKTYNTKKKKLLGAFLGTLYSIAYIYPKFNLLFTVPFKVLIMTFIVLISFTYQNKKECIKIMLTFYLVNIFISGSTFFIIYFTGISHMKISFLIVCAYISSELLKYIYNDIKTMKQIKEMTKEIDISFLHNKFRCRALLDSGNLLKDPIGNNDVIIIKSSVLEEILPEFIVNYDYKNIDAIKVDEIISLLDDDLSAKVRLIPYKHAGNNQSNIILGFKADYVEVDKRKIGNIILGISNFDDNEYSAIVSPSIFV